MENSLQNDLENWLRLLIGSLILIGIAALVSLAYWSWAWWRANAEKDVRNFPRDFCPICSSHDVELLYGSEDDYECSDCGAVWWV